VGFRNEHDHAHDGHCFMMWVGEQITERGIGKASR